MGMFDELTCKYPLPLPGMQDRIWETKDTPAQYLDRYEIREDGTLWHQFYDIEDQSEAGKWMAANPGKDLPAVMEGLNAFAGCMARVNKRWVQLPDFTGEIRFYGCADESKRGAAAGWIDFSAYFLHGKLQQLNLIEFTAEYENAFTRAVV